MREAIAGGDRHASYQAAVPESDDISAEGHHHKDTTDADLPQKCERLHAILHLQKTRSRVMEESTASFEQVWNERVSAAKMLCLLLLLFSINFGGQRIATSPPRNSQRYQQETCLESFQCKRTACQTMACQIVKVGQLRISPLGTPLPFTFLIHDQAGWPLES